MNGTIFVFLEVESVLKRRKKRPALSGAPLSSLYIAQAGARRLFAPVFGEESTNGCLGRTHGRGDRKGMKHGGEVVLWTGFCQIAQDGVIEVFQGK